MVNMESKTTGANGAGCAGRHGSTIPTLRFFRRTPSLATARKTPIKSQSRSPLATTICSASSEIMKTHELKTDPAPFDEVAAGRKTHELRKDDRDFEVGDTLRLRKTRYTGAAMASGAPLEYTGEEETKTVSHILRGPSYGLAGGWAILSLNVEVDRGVVKAGIQQSGLSPSISPSCSDSSSPRDDQKDYLSHDKKMNHKLRGLADFLGPIGIILCFGIVFMIGVLVCLLWGEAENIISPTEKMKHQQNQENAIGEARADNAATLPPATL